MKNTLIVLIMTLVSTMAMATDSGPSIEPGPSIMQDSAALNILIYQVPSKKMTDLKKDTNKMAVHARRINPNTTEYTYTSGKCITVKSLGPAVRCSVDKALKVVEKTEDIIPGKIVKKTYEVGEVTRVSAAQ